MLGIDKYAYESKILKVNPQEKVCICLIFLVVAIGFSSFIVSLLTLATMIYITLFKGGMKGKNYFPLFLIPMAFLLIGTMTIMITKIPFGTAYLLGVTIGDNLYGFTKASLFFGINLILKSLAALSAMYFLALTTPLKDILFVFKKWKMPLIVIELMELIYRFIFIVYSESRKIYVAQASRMGYSTFRNSIKSLGTLGSMLFLRGLKRSDRIFNALESRGYNGNIVLLADEYEKRRGSFIYIIIWVIIVVGVGLLEKGLYRWLF